MSRAQRAPLFPQRIITAIVQLVLNLPVFAHQLEQPLGTRLLHSQTGDPICDFVHHLAILDACEGAFQLEDLLHRRPIQVSLQGTTNGDGPLLNPPMSFFKGLGSAKISVRGRAETWGAGFGRKQALNVLARFWLVVFDDPDLLAIRLHDLERQLPLCQEGIARDDFAP